MEANREAALTCLKIGKDALAIGDYLQKSLGPVPPTGSARGSSSSKPHVLEEIQEVALAYHAKGSDKCRGMFKKFFDSLDTDGNGSISVKEFQSYIDKNYAGMFKQELFCELDQDGNGYLDFQEVITLFYMVTMRVRWCDCCKEFLKKAYFTCAHCFLDDSNEQSYDICVTCYRTKPLNHQHELFLDNYAMLTVAQTQSRKDLANFFSQTWDDGNATRSVSCVPGRNTLSQGKYVIAQGMPTSTSEYQFTPPQGVYNYSYAMPPYTMQPQSVMPQQMHYNYYQMPNIGVQPSLTSSQVAYYHQHNMPSSISTAYIGHSNMGSIHGFLDAFNTTFTIGQAIATLATIGVCTIM